LRAAGSHLGKPRCLHPRPHITPYFMGALVSSP
jgi:hypothetical protein